VSDAATRKQKIDLAGLRFDESDPAGLLLSTLNTALAIRKQLDALTRSGVYTNTGPLVTFAECFQPEARYALELFASAHEFELTSANGFLTCSVNGVAFAKVMLAEDEKRVAEDDQMWIPGPV
jgi:hypothetical protein